MPPILIRHAHRMCSQETSKIRSRPAFSWRKKQTKMDESNQDFPTTKVRTTLTNWFGCCFPGILLHSLVSGSRIAFVNVVEELLLFLLPFVAGVIVRSFPPPPPKLVVLAFSPFDTAATTNLFSCPNSILRPSSNACSAFSKYNELKIEGKDGGI